MVEKHERATRTFISIAVILVFLLALSGSDRVSQASSPAVNALFDLSTPGTAPFPSDWFTVADRSNNTGLRVNLPLPDCAVRKSDCEDLAVINTLDGFDLQPRLRIPFDGPIAVSTVTSQAVFLISLDDTLTGTAESRAIGITRVVWDPATQTLSVEPAELLKQHTRYAIIVTDRVTDPSGSPVGGTPRFRSLPFITTPYGAAVMQSVRSSSQFGVAPADVVAASVFTTQTVTTVLEKMRDQIKAATPEPADFRLGPGGTRTVFPLAAVTGITWNQQTGANPPRFNNTAVNLPLLQIVSGAVGTIAFGKYTSPDYEIHPGEFIPPIGTRTGTPERQDTNEVYFNLFVPSGPKPTSGWPVAIFGHGNNQNKNLAFNVAATMAAHGIATIAINAVGSGFGALGTMTVNQVGGGAVTFSAGGRGIDQNGDHIIDSNEGFGVAPPRAVLFFADGTRQTVADLMQMVRVLEGMDVDGDGFPDLNPSRIYYFGHSLGSNYGTIFLAVEPTVQVGALASLGGPAIENRRLSPVGRPVLAQLLVSRVQPLINVPGIARLAGVPLGAPLFHENFPLRNGLALSVQLADGTSQQIQSPVINTVAGAMAIQEFVEHTIWASRSGDPVAYAPYLRKTPLAGLSPKAVICQFSKGDQTVANPNATALLRAGGLADRTTFYHHDVAYFENPMLPKNPHGFMVSTDIAAFRPIALAVQEQIAVFFGSYGALIIPAQPTRFFETPIAGPLPEDLNFIP